MLLAVPVGESGLGAVLGLRRQAAVLTDELVDLGGLPGGESRAAQEVAADSRASRTACRHSARYG